MKIFIHFHQYHFQLFSFVFLSQFLFLNYVVRPLDMNSTTNGTSHIPPNGIGALTFTPMLAPNAIFTTVYTILLILQLVLTVRFWRYYGYAIGMLGGLILELVGYIAKVQLSYNRADKNGYIM